MTPRLGNLPSDGHPRQLLGVFLRALIELLFACCRAEEVRPAFVHARVLWIGLAHIHFADWIRCHETHLIGVNGYRLRMNIAKP